MFIENILNPFLKMIDKYANHNAFYINEKYYTYSELAKYISKIRIELQATKTNSKIIGLVANDDIETYASIFALWLEGLAYVPLHPQQPTERNLELISQTNIDLIINSGDRILFSDVRNIESSNLIFEELMLVPKPTPENALAYILFTSGSTGKSKGVPTMRSSVDGFMQSFFDIGFPIRHDDRCLQAFDLTFDGSVKSFLVPLTKGACTYTVPHIPIKYTYIFGLIEDHNLTFSTLVPSFLKYLRPYFGEISLPSMRYSILTAEASSVELLREWAVCVPNADIYNFYGPTETTIYCTYYKYRRESFNKQYNGMISIGKAMNGVKTIIIDEEKKELKSNVKGELCIAGRQLTPGYFNLPEKNKESFFEVNDNNTMTRYYRTGDLCYVDDDRDIMYCGRLDYQIKIQGYRIELGEIEHYASEGIHGRSTIAIAFENDIGNTEIALFIEGDISDKISFVEYLKSKLPKYMMPSKIFPTSEFPLNKNGKIDRNVLKMSLNKS